MRHVFTDPDREKAIEIGNIAIYSYEIAGCGYLAKAWRGKQRKAYGHYRFKTEDKRTAWCREQVEDDRARTAEKAEYKLEDSKRLEAMREQLKVGSILHSSWGYDQTNCDFYEVVERKAKSVILRPIGGIRVDGSHLKPNPGHFIGEPFRKVINSCGVKIASYSNAYPVEPDSKHYETPAGFGH